MKKKLRPIFLLVLMGISLVYSGTHQSVAAEADEYTIGIEDVLSVSVLELPELKGTATVGPDGTIVLPSPIGVIRAEGLTRPQLEDRVREKLADYIKGDIHVSVQVTEYKSRKIAIFGEVRTPGTFSFVKIPSFSEVLARAGGLTPTADPTKIRIIPVENQAPTKTVNFEALLQDAHPSWPKLMAGDTIFVPAKPPVEQVPTVSQAPTGETPPPETAPQEKQAVFIHVLGQVRTPGSFEFPTPPSLPHVLAQAGGVIQPTLLKRVQITREDGTSLTVDMKEYIATGHQLPQLQSGDLVYVYEADTTSQGGVTILGAVGAPGSYPADQPTSLMYLLAKAGGVAENADVTQIQITRETTDFIETKIVNLHEDVPDVQPGDKVWIPRKTETVSTLRNAFEIVRSALLVVTTIFVVTR